MRTTGVVQRLARNLRIAARFLIPRQRPGTVRSLRQDHLESRRAERRHVHRRTLPGWLLLSAALGATNLSAATIYVDSRSGDDRYDGLSATVTSNYSGPIRTLTRAVEILERSDEIWLVNNGTPYVGELTLHGVNKSGSPEYPVIIHGNNSVLSGATLIEPTAWTRVTGDIRRITPHRKGWCQLVQGDAAVPEIGCPRDAEALPELGEETWCYFQGAIYYRPPYPRYPGEIPLSFAVEQTGITLIDVDYVVIRDLTVRHFRQDGIQLHDRCRNVVLENVTTTENGRVGVVVGGSSTALLNNVTSTGNRAHSLLVEELGAVDVEGGDINPAPVVTVDQQ